MRTVNWTWSRDRASTVGIDVERSVRRHFNLNADAMSADARPMGAIVDNRLRVTVVTDDERLASRTLQLLQTEGDSIRAEWARSIAEADEPDVLVCEALLTADVPVIPVESLVASSLVGSRTVNPRRSVDSAAWQAAATLTDYALTELTNDEMAVMSELARGNSDETIGRNLGVSNETVDRHINGLKARLGVDSVASLIAISMQQRTGPT